MTRPDDLAATVIDGLLDQQDIAVDEVIFGCANQAGEDNRNVARMATLLSRLGEGAPALTVNRLCASGLDAIITATRTIRDGGAEIIIAGGVGIDVARAFRDAKTRNRLFPHIGNP
ncbi:MAG: beta-ketoacyl synthase N-terminal-like domain-containing protein [Cypionkella sp.]